MSRYSHQEYERREQDFYPTPPCLGLVLTQEPLRGPIQAHRVWEPCCGEGALVPHLKAAGAVSVFTSDIVDYGIGQTAVADFLDVGSPQAEVLVTNPPYALPLCEQIVRQAIQWVERGQMKTAIFLLPMAWHFAGTRNDMFLSPAYAGHVVCPWRPYWTDERKSTPRQSFAWHIWDFNADVPTLYRAPVPSLEVRNGQGGAL